MKKAYSDPMQQDMQEGEPIFGHVTGRETLTTRCKEAATAHGRRSTADGRTMLARCCEREVMWSLTARRCMNSDVTTTTVNENAGGDNPTCLAA